LIHRNAWITGNRSHRDDVAALGRVALPDGVGADCGPVPWYKCNGLAVSDAEGSFPGAGAERSGVHQLN